ncbi:helix-turn-helix domain-containing protein [Tropicibacter naphthalenivorans]|uniref:HTH-type transcriptional regulator ImmR n=1 Tax=Tropicibacter naphthalenivorans TaxID=441103 RepID=A0A0P1GSZ6_9RHOB|nr:helix-turn-helix transcriptional regulator [Tropicibacter naphthalenivorans]CUH78568.1 HTH-type transcriptional regulator ImmR [Tropicibacter naphthalenivorans]SMC80937.1 Helix-turn-helix [Tropicibacter naphthalenivorans]
MNDTTNGWYSSENATFGDRLAAAREAAGMDQATLAKRLGLKVKTLETWENDLTEPRANRLQMLAGILNVSMVWLITGEGADGVSEPEEDPISPDVNEVLMELRGLRAQFLSRAERLGRLEKKLRLLLKEEG